MPQPFNVADLTVSSPAFEPHGAIPARHSGDGDDVAPALAWTGVPAGTRAFAVVVHDPDAPLVDGFTNWVAYGIAGDARGLPEGGGDAVNGTNSFRSAGYNGPAPPPGTGRTITTSGSTRSTATSSTSRGSIAGNCSSASRTT